MRSSELLSKPYVWVAFALVTALLTVCWYPLNHWMLTGRLFPIDNIERLTNPIHVSGWNDEGLITGIGEVIKIPGIEKLPRKSAALEQIVQRGVEIHTDGSVTGLARIHHWCGNDPVRTHIVRVDVSSVLMYAADSRNGGFRYGDFGEHGWDVSDYYSFKNQWLPHCRTNAEKQ